MYSDGVATFVETGDSGPLLAGVEMSSVLDLVTAPAITAGAGTTSATVFVDGVNSKVAIEES